MINKNGDDFGGVRIRLLDGEEVGKITNIRHVGRTKSMQKVFEINYTPPADFCKAKQGVAGTITGFGPSPLQAIIRDLIYLDLLERENARLFLDRHGDHMSEQEREDFMEKYGVKIDQNKVDAAKKAPGEKTAGVNDPKVNVPKHPTKGTEPFEKKPDGE